MSARNGYYLMADDVLEGPFRTAREAKEASASVKSTVAIRTVITVERRDEHGKWVTVH